MTGPTDSGPGPAVEDEQPQSPREEAERLVASLLGAAAVAIQGAQARRQLRDLADRVLGPDWFGAAGGSGTGGGSGAAGGGPGPGETGDTPGTHGFATGSAECCVCPVCRVITVLRDPSPEFAERLATGAGDLAAGVASVLRAFGEAFGGATARPAGGGDPWGSATHGSEANGSEAEGAGARPPGQRRPMAKKAVKKAAPPVPDDEA